MKINNSKVLEDLKNGIPLKLDLGCGAFGQMGCYTVDIVDINGVDIVADLNCPMDLLPDNSVSYVYSRHTLEHIKDILVLIKEIHRITQSEGKVEIIVPHFSNVFGYSDPTHVRLFGLYSMFYFVSEHKQTQKRKVPVHYSNAYFFVEKIRIRFYKYTLYDKIVGGIFYPLVNLSMPFQEFYERRLSHFFHAWEIKYIMKVDK